LIVVACLVGLSALTALVALNPDIPGDMALVESAIRLRNDPLTAFIQVLTFISSSVPALLICMALSVLEWLRLSHTPATTHRPAQGSTFMLALRAAWPLVAFGVSVIVNIALRIAIGRMRPGVDFIANLLPELQADFQRYSFPSGHAGAAMVAYAALALVMSKRTSARWAFNLFSSGVILGVGFGRIYLGVHWPTDVLGGYLLGALCLSAVLTLWQHLWPHARPIVPRVTTHGFRADPSSLF
jgi:undecaprenyl-diphosphatase